MFFFTPDTDALFLAVVTYDKLCRHTSMAMVSSTMEVGPIWKALGREKAAALPVFHAFDGAMLVDSLKWVKQSGFNTTSKLIAT